MTIWRMRIECWITKATDIHSEYVILIAFPRHQLLHKRATLSRLFLRCLSYSLPTITHRTKILLSFRVLPYSGLPGTNTVGRGTCLQFAGNI
jgi:hypothetical protein